MLTPKFSTATLSFISLLIIMLWTSCSTQQRDNKLVIQNTDEKSIEIIDQSIKHCGGIKKWQDMKSLSYHKDFQLLDAEGNIEKDYRQTHSYKYNPTHIHIYSIENGDTIITEYVNQTYSRSINGQYINTPQESIAKSINTSTYVIGIPFKLLDKGTLLTYDGERTLDSGQTVDVISASYDADKYDNHSSTDHWKYYFDKENRRVVGNWVQTSDHYSQIENLTFIEEGGILFNGRRESNRVDEKGNKLFLRARYNYYNYKVEY